MNFPRKVAFVLPFFALAAFTTLHAQVVISEIHYHPVEKANFDAAGNPVFSGTSTPANLGNDVHEFVEIQNAGAAAVDLSGWTLSGGINFTFPAGTLIESGDYRVIAVNPARIAAVYGLTESTILGPYTGQLSNRADTVRLRNTAGSTIDAVSYSSAFPWAISADALGANDDWTLLDSGSYQYKGRSLERVSVTASSNDPANWLASPLAAGPSPGVANAVSRAVPKPVVVGFSTTQSSDGATIIRAGQEVRVDFAFSSTVSLTGVVVEYFIDDINLFTEPRAEIAATDLGGGRFMALLPGQVNRSVVRFRFKADRGDGLEVVSPRADDPQVIPIAAQVPASLDPATREAWHSYFVSPVRTSTNNKPIYECFISSADPTSGPFNGRNGLATLNFNITQNPVRVTVDHPNALPRDKPYVPNTAPQWNGTVPGIFIVNGQVRDVQIRYHGSRYNRRASRNDFKVQFLDYQPYNGSTSTFITDKGNEFVVGQALFIAAGLPISAVRYVDWYLNNAGVLQRLEQGEYDGDLLDAYHEKIQRQNPGSVKEATGEYYKSIGIIDGQMANGESPYGNGNERPLPAVTPNPSLVNPQPPAAPRFRLEGWTSVQRYEWTYALQNHGWKGAKPFKDFVDGMWAARGDTYTAPNYSGPNHANYAQVRAFMDANVDVDATLTSIAMSNWMGPWDDTTQNHFLWRRANGKWVHLPWDMDAWFAGDKQNYSIFVGENGDPSNNFRGPNWFKDTFIKTYRTEFRQRMWELNNSLFDPANIVALGYNQYNSFYTARRSNVNTQVATLGTYFKPSRPTATEPANAATVLPETMLVASPYAHSNVTAPSAHTSSKWEIRPASGSYDNPAYVLRSTTDLTSTAVPFDQLIYGQTYFWRVTYLDAENHPSIVSAERSFTYGASSVSAGNIVLNEVLANNRSAVLNGGRRPDYIELKNNTGTPIDISGFGLSDDALVPAKFAFPAGTSVPANGYLLVWCDNDTRAPGLHTGFALDSGGETLTLTQGGSIVDSITFGPQAADLSIGRDPDGTGGFSLNNPTAAAPNSARTPLGSAANLRINEWMADTNNEDWFEVYNADPEPVQLGNLYLSDTPSVPTLTKIPALSFIAGHGFAEFLADGSTAGGNHCDFRLSTVGDSIILTNVNGIVAISAVTFGQQQREISEGRFPDGAETIISFPRTPTRGASNFLPATVVINEALTSSTDPFEDAIELFNPTANAVDISGWWLSDDPAKLQKFHIPAGTTIAAGAFKVFYEEQFNPTPGIGDSFSLRSFGDELILSAVDGNGLLTGDRAQVRFGGAPDGVSFGRVVTSNGSDFFPQVAHTLGQDAPASVAEFRSGAGAVNSAPTNGPIIISEVMYHPPELGGIDNARDEFIELSNITAEPVEMSGWVLQNAIDFTFPAGTMAMPGESFIVVGFDPANEAALNAFRAIYGMSSNIRVYGPATERLVNSTANVELARAGTPLGGETPYFIVDHVEYSDTAPWSVAADGSGSSLQRLSATAFGNDPANWVAAGPTAGQGPPFVRTLNATEIGATSAQLNGQVSPNGLATMLEYVLSTVRISGVEVPAETGVATNGKVITGLSPHTLYTYRAEATNALGAGMGEERVFTTLNRPPDAQGKEFHSPVPGPFELDVLASDSDSDGDTLTITGVTQGAHGTVTTNGGKVFYTPASEYTGNDLFTYIVSDGFGGEDSASVTLRNNVPMVTADTAASNGEAVTFDPRANDIDADGDPLVVTAVTQGNGGAVSFSPENITYTPGTQFSGRDSFTYTISDGVASASGSIVVRSNIPIVLVGPVKGAQVPGQPPGTVYATLGLPTRGIFAGALQTGAGAAQPAIFGADGTALLKSGDAAPGVSGAMITGLRDPSGQAVLATLRGSLINDGNDTALYVGLGEGSLRVGAREGDTLAPGLTLTKILSIDGNGTTVFFLATVSGPLVKKSDRVLCGISPAAEVQVLAREGDLVTNQPVTDLGTLVAMRGTLAEGRWRTGAAEIGVRLTFPDRSQALYAIPMTATSPEGWTSWGKSGDQYGSGGSVQSFGVPGFSSDGVSYAGQLVRGQPATVTRSNNVALIRKSAQGAAVLAQKSGSVPGLDGAPVPGLKFKSFADPVAGAQGTTAFNATVAGPGVNATNRAGLWFAGDDNTLRLLARAGEPAVGGGRWGAFQSLVLPDGLDRGPIFTALLAVKGTGAVSRQTSQGLWGLDSTGTLQLLLRSGQVVMVNGGPQTIKSFVALSPAFGERGGAATGFDDDGHVQALATFKDGSQALLQMAIP